MTAVPAPYGSGLAVVPEIPPAPIVHRLERDAVDRLIAKTTDDGRTDYSYDAVDQLTAVTFTDLQGNAQALGFAYDALGQLLTEQSSAGGLHHHYDVVGASLKPNMTATVIRWVKPALIGRACACGKSIGIARPAMVHAEENRLRRARGMGPNQMLKRGKLEIRLMSQAIHNSLVKTGIITQQQVRTARRSATSFAKRKGCF